MRYYCERYGITPRGLELLRRIVTTPVKVDDRSIDFRVLDPLRKKGWVYTYATPLETPDFFSRKYPGYWMITQKGYDLYMMLMGVDPHDSIHSRRPKVPVRLRLIKGGKTDEKKGATA